MGDIAFIFRHFYFNTNLKENKNNLASYYGYVFFRQEKNSNIVRGYLQV